MIYDCFSFFNELDILEIRLNTLNDVVDKFVIVEAPWTFTGIPKPLYFDENKKRFAPFLNRIIHIIANDPPTSPTATNRENAWIRESWQRNQLAQGLTDATPEDLLIISDLDEIPDPTIIKKISLSNDLDKKILNLNLRSYAFFLNNRCISNPVWHGGPQILKAKTFLDPSTYTYIKASEYAPECANALPSATFIRFAPHKKNVKNAGWHFSYMGGIKAIQKKLLSFSHTELQHIARDTAKIKQIIDSGKGFFGFGDRYMAEPIENCFPVFITRNPERFKELLLFSSVKKWKWHFLHRIFYRVIKNIHSNFILILTCLTPRFLHPAMHKIRVFTKL